MLGRKPLCPGEDYMDQLRLIIKLLGMPSDREMECVEHEKARDYIRNKFGSFKVCIHAGALYVLIHMRQKYASTASHVSGRDV